MKFRDFAESLLGSRVKVKLIRQLLSSDTFASERDTAARIGVSHNAVNKTLKEFQDMNLITPMTIGNVLIWELNKDSYAYKFIENFSKKIATPPVEELRNDIKILIGDMCSAIKLRDEKIKTAIIFGSVAEGRELSNSDIDLFILVEDEKTKKKIVSELPNMPRYFITLKKYGNKLSPLIMSKSEYHKSKNKKLLENIRKGIVVIENENTKS